MADMSVDTYRVRECGNNITELTKEYQTTIESLFNRLEKVSENDEWYGKSASKFIEICRKNKADYVALGKELQKYGNILKQGANDLEIASNKNII